MQKTPLTLCNHLFTSVLAAVLFAPPFTLRAAVYNWTGAAATSTSWGTNANWSNNILPTFDNTADVQFNVSVKPTNWIGANRTIRSLMFGPSLTTNCMVNLQDFEGGGGTPRSMTMDANSGNVSITVANVPYQIRIGNSGKGGTFGSLILADNLDIIHNGTGELFMNRPIDGPFGFTKTGTGTLTLGIDNNYTGKTVLSGGSTLINNASQLRLGANPSTYTADSLTISNNARLISSNTTTTNVTWNPNRGITIGDGGGAWQITGFVGVILDSPNLLNGTSNFEKTGSGTLTLSAPNLFSGTYSNSTTFSGTTVLNHELALANSTLILNTNSIFIFSNSAGTNFTLGGLATSTNVNTPLTNSAGAPIKLTVGGNNQSTTYRGVLSQGGSLVKVGSGTLELAGGNSFSGSLTVSGGTVLATLWSGVDFTNASSINLDGGALIYDPNWFNKSVTNTPVVVTAPSTLGWRNQSGTSYNLSFSGPAGFALNSDLTITNASTDTTLGNAITISRNMTGVGNLTNIGFNNLSSRTNNYGLGRLLLNGDNSNWNGNLVISRGVVNFGLPTSLGNGTIILGSTDDSSGAGLTGFVATNVAAANSTINFANPIIVRSGGFRSINIGSDQRFNFTGNIALDGTLSVNSATFWFDRNFTFAGNISGVGGLDLTRSGSGGAINLTGSNSYSGPTSISSGADVVANSFSGSAIGDLSAVSITGTNTVANLSGRFNSRLRVATSETIGSLSAPTDNADLIISLGATLTTGGDNTSTTYAGYISGSGGITKLGTGTMTLSGTNNTHTGSTTVNEGTLALANPLALQNSPLVTTGAGLVSLDVGISSPTFGGLSGESGNLNTIISNYGSVTNLTLNPAAGSVLTYGGVIADGATGMSLTKTGAGTQILSGANTYTGTTTVSGGTLVVSNSNLTANIQPGSTEIIFPTQPSVGNYNVLPGPLNTASLPASFSGTGGLAATLTNSPNLQVIVSSGPTFGTTYPVGSEDFIGPNGLKNLMSYALGGTGPSSTPALPVLTSDGTRLTLTANIRMDGQGVRVVGEYAYSLDGPWNPVDLTATGAPSTVPNTTVKAFFQDIESGQPKKFLRLRATQTQ